MKQKEIKSSLWLVSEKIISLGLNLGVMILVARNLGPESFGDLNYLLAIFAFLAPITALGLNSIITRELLLRVNDEVRILGTSITIRIIGGTIALIIIVGLIKFSSLSKGFDLELLVLAIANIFTAAYIFDFYFQAHLRNHQVVKTRLTVLAITSIIRLSGVYYDQSLNFFVWVAAIEVLLISLGFSIYYYKNTKNLFHLKASIKEGNSLLKKSGWLIFSGVAAIVYLKVDQIMLGLLGTSSEVGIYAVAARLSEAWYFIPTAIVISFFPKLIKMKNNTPNYTMQLQKLNDGLLVLAISVAIPTTLLAKYIILILYGEEYSKASIVLSIHIWAGTFIFMRALLSKWLINEELLKFSFITQSIGAIVNIVMNYALIPHYGAIGAAIATIVSYGFASYVALIFHRKTMPMAIIITKSFLLPLRLCIYRKSLYKD